MSSLGESKRLGLAVLVTLVLISTRFPLGRCQDDDDDGGGAGTNPLLAGVINDRLMSLTGNFKAEIGQSLGFCIKNTLRRLCSSELIVLYIVLCKVTVLMLLVVVLLTGIRIGMRRSISRWI